MTAAVPLDHPASPDAQREAAPRGTAPRETTAGSAPPAAAGGGPDTEAASPGQRLATAASDLLVAAIDRLAGLAADKVDDVMAKLDDLKADGGVGLNAVIAGGLAKLAGRNPVWAAIKGAVGAMSTTTKVVVALLLVLTAVLAPVVLLVLAVLLLVLAIVGAFTGGR